MLTSLYNHKNSYSRRERLRAFLGRLGSCDDLQGPPRRASIIESSDARRTELATRDAAHGAAAREKRALARNAVEAPRVRSRRQKAVLSADDQSALRAIHKYPWSENGPVDRALAQACFSGPLRVQHAAQAVQHAIARRAIARSGFAGQERRNQNKAARQLRTLSSLNKCDYAVAVYVKCCATVRLGIEGRHEAYITDHVVDAL